jgi:hypothetical protein
MDAFEREYVDIKQLDARLLVDYLSGPPLERAPVARVDFPVTGHWRQQFDSTT